MVYVNFAIINNGAVPTSARFYTALKVDGETVEFFFSDPPLNPNFYVAGVDFDLGSLSSGIHTIQIVVDSTEAIDESNENDNSYTKVFSVESVPTEPWLYTIDDGSDDGSSTLFKLGTTAVAGQVGLDVVGETGVKGIFDIAFAGDRIVGVAPRDSTDLFVSIDSQSGAAEAIGTLTAAGHFNALESETADTVLGATTSGELWRINVTTKSATRIGSYGNGLESSGDLALAANGTLYATVSGIFSDTLVTVDRATGLASPIGAIGYTGTFGLAIRPDTGALLGIVNGDGDPSLVTIDKTTGKGALVGAIPAPAGLTGLAVRTDTVARLTVNNVNVGNVGTIGNVIDVWFDATSNGAPIVDPSKYAVRIISSDGSRALTTSGSLRNIGSSRLHATMTIVPNQLTGTPCAGKTCFEDGHIQIYDSASGADVYTIPNLVINAYGTPFDMNKHAYQFRNGVWGNASLTWFTDPYFRAGDTVASYILLANREVFWKSVGEYQFLFLVFARRSEGLCYGMANSVIANFTHRAEGSFWSDRDTSGSQCAVSTYCYYNSAIDNSWQRGIDARWLAAPPGLPFDARNKPYSTEDVYHDTYTNGAWTVEAAKKIMYYFLTQVYFSPAKAGEWPGQDRKTAPVIVAGAPDPLMKELLRNGNPISLSLSFVEGGGHEIVASELIQWGSSQDALTNALLTYDNNYPVPVTASASYAPFERVAFNESTTQITLDLVRQSDGQAIPTAGETIRPTDTNFRFLTVDGDSQDIYVMPGRVLNAEWPADPAACCDDVTLQDTTEDNYIRVIAVGASSFKVYSGTTNTEIELIQNGNLDGSQAVYTHGDLVTELYLPPAGGKLYRVEVTKSASLSRLKVFTSVPISTTTLEKCGYDNIETGSTDATKAILYVGATNTNRIVTRIAASSVQDQRAPTYVIDIQKDAGGRRHAARH